MRALGTAIAVATYVVMGGFFTQNGVILSAAAAAFHTSVPATAAMFSYLVGGNLVGLIACMAAFNVLSIRQVLAGAYVILFAGVGLLFAAHDLALGELAIGMCGFGAGVGLSAGAAVLARLYSERARAVAFLGTDCSFSLAGFVFPAFAASSIARGWPWQSGYAAVAAIAVVVFGASFAVTLPMTRGERSAPRRGDAASVVAPGAAPRSRASWIGIAAFAFGLACYLCGQGAFMTWAPQWLASGFGVPALEASAVIGTFWQWSLFGLIAAALVVSRIPPRFVVLAAGVAAVGALVACMLANDAHAFFVATAAFGFLSTSLFKLMISLGSEQLATAPPQLVTFMLLSASIGGTIAPALSAVFVANSNAHAGIVMAAVCYTGTLLAALAGVTLGYRTPAPTLEFAQAA